MSIEILTEDQKELMEHCIECNGAEIPEALWEDAKVLVERGFATLSEPRGPENGWRRITPVTKPIYSVQ